MALKITENTPIPLKAVIALLIGCATFTSMAFTFGSYFGNRDANAASLEKRVSDLESAVKEIPEIAKGIARLEGALGTLPDNKRVPAGHGN